MRGRGRDAVTALERAAAALLGPGACRRAIGRPAAPRAVTVLRRAPGGVEPIPDLTADADPVGPDLDRAVTPDDERLGEYLPEIASLPRFHVWTLGCQMNRSDSEEMAGRLMPTDKQRIVRALEVLETTGRSLADWQREPGTPVLAEADTTRLLVMPERQAQDAAIEARFDAMLAEGALEEVRHLLGCGFSTELPIMRALGVAPLAAHLSGNLTLEEAAHLVATRGTASAIIRLTDRPGFA